LSRHELDQVDKYPDNPESFLSGDQFRNHPIYLFKIVSLKSEFNSAISHDIE